MDNLTHTLAGLVTAEIAIDVRRRGGETIDARWARAAWLVSAAAHNAPDVDFVYAWITEGKLGYLLHHRGHTHTLALAPLMALLPLALALAWARRRGVAWSRAERAWLALLAGLGPIGHLLLDLSNNYGIHPLWPLSDRWIAGDTIFIVEPLFFAATIPCVLLATEARWGRIAWSVALALALALPWAVPFVGWPSALATTLLAAGAIGIGARTSRAARGWTALGASLAVLVTFALAGASAEARLREVLGAAHPDREVLDVARSPLPTDPTCWTAIALEDAPRDRGYVLHVAFVSLAGDVSRCEGMFRERPTAPGSDRERVGAGDVALALTHRAPIDRVRALAARCDGAAFLRFARMPTISAGEGGSLVLGDLRYDREPGLGFAELEVPADAPRGSACPRAIPPWIPWRAADLLRDRGGVVDRGPAGD